MAKYKPKYIINRADILSLVLFNSVEKELASKVLNAPDPSKSFADG